MANQDIFGRSLHINAGCDSPTLAIFGSVLSMEGVGGTLVMGSIYPDYNPPPIGQQGQQGPVSESKKNTPK